MKQTAIQLNEHKGEQAIKQLFKEEPDHMKRS